MDPADVSPEEQVYEEWRRMREYRECVPWKELGEGERDMWRAAYYVALRIATEAAAASSQGQHVMTWTGVDFRCAAEETLPDGTRLTCSLQLNHDGPHDGPTYMKWLSR